MPYAYFASPFMPWRPPHPNDMTSRLSPFRSTCARSDALDTHPLHLLYNFSYISAREIRSLTATAVSAQRSERQPRHRRGAMQRHHPSPSQAHKPTVTLAHLPRERALPIDSDSARGLPPSRSSTHDSLPTSPFGTCAWPCSDCACRPLAVPHAALPLPRTLPTLHCSTACPSRHSAR